MRRCLAVLAVVALAASACASGSGNERRVLIDFSSDEFGSFALANFPSAVTVAQGQTIVFKQTWTGEPHTVTGGSVVSDALNKGAGWLRMFDAFEDMRAAIPAVIDPSEAPPSATFAEWAASILGAPKSEGRDGFVKAWDDLRAQGFALPDLHNPGKQSLHEVNDAVDELSGPAFDGVLFALDDEGVIAQNVGQPCYLKTGAPPSDSTKPCAKADQRQPEFDGTQSFYNSGILKYEGPEGNTFKIKLADDIKPGTYTFYCAVHGPGQITQVTVKPRGASVPSQGAVTRQARKQIDALLEPLQKVYRAAVKTNTVKIDDESVEGPFAGLAAPGQDHTAVNEFVPKTIRAKVNEPIVWKMMGADHTITFDVPRYFPIVDFSANGVKLNPTLSEPAGGAPKKPDQEGGGVIKMDGGTYSGKGFWSSGLISAEPYLEYTLRIAKPGTYNYACLLHPPMVGKVVVTA
jgi:plastocyanin